MESDLTMAAARAAAVTRTPGTRIHTPEQISWGDVQTTRVGKTDGGG